MNIPCRSPFATASGLISVALLLIAPAIQAGSATWKSNPTSGDWNTAANWSPATVPNSFNDLATFDTSTATDVAISADTGVEGIVFSSGASAFTITANSEFGLEISVVAGITNASAVIQNFVVATQIACYGSVQAGPGVVFTVDGSLFFAGSSHAGSATLIAQGNSQPGGVINFLGHAHGDTARVEVFGYGALRLDRLSRQAPQITIGSIEGDGSVLLGSKNLTVGGNKINTTFSGVIDDGGAGGSLTVKMQRRTLFLTGANTYSGGTTIKSGTLSVSNQSGSGTGTGPVQVNGGRRGSLRGNGTIFGPVTVGDGNAIADFTPQSPQTNTGTLTIKDTLTFNPISEYQWVINSANSIASRVVAAGVTINSNASFFAFDTAFANLPRGTVLTAIKNTSANPIAGTFSNLADGSTIIVHSNSFKVNYEGGDGNDLTLTVQ